MNANTVKIASRIKTKLNGIKTPFTFGDILGRALRSPIIVLPITTRLDVLQKLTLAVIAVMNSCEAIPMVYMPWMSSLLWNVIVKRGFNTLSMSINSESAIMPRSSSEQTTSVSI
jgi:hypothetical protein